MAATAAATVGEADPPLVVVDGIGATGPGDSGIDSPGRAAGW
jgi:hypothetical protein